MKIELQDVEKAYYNLNPTIYLHTLYAYLKQHENLFSQN